MQQDAFRWAALYQMVCVWQQEGHQAACLVKPRALLQCKQVTQHSLRSTKEESPEPLHKGINAYRKCRQAINTCKYIVV